MTQMIDSQQRYAEQFQGMSFSEGPAWLPPLRRAAMSRFSELGFPTRHDEEWRFTHIGPIAETAFQPAETAPHLTADALTGTLFEGAINLVFVNGRYAPELSSQGKLPKGLKAGSLADALKNDASSLEPHLGRYAGFENHAFVALNTALFEDGPFVAVARGAVIEEPIHLLYVSTGGETPTVTHPRALIVGGENSQATVLETFIGTSDTVYFTNAVTEVVLEANAVLDHYKVNRESLSAYHIATLQTQLARSSNFSSHSITVGGSIVRNDANAVLSDEGIECTLNGLYLANGKRLVDNHTAIDHAMPNCNSHEVYKGILDDQARGVFNGKIFVRQDAQKTDAKQTNKTLLLSEDAQINTKPQLEIFADDVKCTHGATVGQLDSTQLFYLRSRGIAEADARAMLIYAFAGDIVNRIKIEAVRDQLDELLLAHLPRR